MKSPSGPSAGRAAVGLALMLVLAAAGIAFSGSLFNGATNWDDGVYLTNNPVLRQAWPENLKTIFLTSYCQDHELKPLVVLSFAIERLWAGESLFWVHLSNLLLHLVNTALVFFLFLGLGKRRVSVAFWTAALFALHPLRVESVAWIAERKDVLYAFFWLVSVLCYLRGRTLSVYLLSILFFILAVSVKPIALMLPFILFLFDWLQKSPEGRPVFRDKIPFLILALCLGTLLVQAQAVQMQKVRPGFSCVNAQTVPTACYAVGFYLSKMFWPFNLSCVYPSPSNTDLLFCYSPLLFILAGVSVFYWGRKDRVLLFGVAFFLVSLIPALEMIAINTSFAQDRYTYLASLGPGYILADAFVRFLDRFRNRSFRVLCLIGAVLILAVLGFQTCRRCRVWKNSSTLWSDVMVKYPAMSVAYDGRGIDRLMAGDYPGALEDFNRAIARENKSVTAVNNRGVVYLRMGRYRRAWADFTRAARLIRLESLSASARPAGKTIPEPDLGEVYFNRGVVCQRMGRPDLAVEDYSRALRSKAGDAQLLKARGDIYSRLGMPERAIADYTRAVAIDGAFADALNNRGTQRMRLGRYSEAIDDFVAALSQRSDLAEAARNLDKAVGLQKGYRSFTEAIGFDPKNAKVFYNRGTFLADSGAYRPALEDLGRAIDLDPVLAEAYVNRGSVYQELGMTAKALADYDRALVLKPDLLQAQANRRMILTDTSPQPRQGSMHDSL